VPGFHAGRPPHNKGLRYPADPPKVEEIIAVMRAAGDRPHGRRLRALIVLLWRAGLRIHEALDVTEGDLDQRRGSLLIRHGKGGRRREVGLDAWDGKNCGPGSSRARSFLSVPCCASSTARCAGATGRPLRHAQS
jgi:integrase